ncbi:hypothetical protein MMC26_002903 [Xylographa opegraphella]|nr:hypothetical protein [Xylographa opegraphella]
MATTSTQLLIDRPLGPLVSSTPASHPQKVTLRGRFVNLIPVSTDHTLDLFAATCGPANDALWTYMFSGPFPTLDAFKNHIADIAVSTDPLHFTIVSNVTSKPVGLISLMRIEPNHRVCEVGSILYGPALQRTPGATEAIYLLGRYVFEDLGYRRWEWKCNALNSPSRRAAQRFGFQPEGVFRQHLIVKGRSRDTAWFSVVDGEWEVVGRGMKEWLSEDNFDGEGRQRKRLEEVRDGIAARQK